MTTTPHHLDPVAAHQLMVGAGIVMPTQALAADPESAARAAAEIGFPVALKVLAASRRHKSDGGGVRLGLTTGASVTLAASVIAAKTPDLDGFLVQAMAPAGVELLLGMRRDPVFGPVVLLGLGGVWVEALDDVAVALAPLSRETALDMLGSLRGARLLRGFRGAEALDLDTVAGFALALGTVAQSNPHVLEIDLNPVIALATGAVAVDARVVVGQPAPGSSSLPREREHDVEALLSPRSVAVVGASSNPAKQGSRALRYLIAQGYRGRTYAVNRNGGEVLGQTAYRSIGDLPEVPDLACIAVPAAETRAVVDGCVAAGVRAAVVFSSGFAETGAQGAALQAEIADAARAGGIALCGPNTAGLMRAADNMCAATVMVFESPSPGGGEIAMVSQSGAVASSLLGRGWAEGTGFSHWICTGNEADLAVADYVRYLALQPEVGVIALFLEAVRDGEAFLDACRVARRAGKPVVIYKTGGSAVGARSVASHSGALAGDVRVYRAAIRAAGAVQVHGLQDLLDTCLALAWQPLPAGPGVGVVSTSGGMCSVVADNAEHAGLQLPGLDDETVAAIRALLPSFAVPQNPVDVTMDFVKRPGMVGDVLEVLLGEPAVNLGLVALTTNADPGASTVATRVIEVARASGKPILVTRLGPERLAPRALALYREARVPVYPMPETAVRVARKMLDYAQARG